MLDQLKKLVVGQPPIDDLIALSAFAKTLRAEYAENAVEVPEWLESKARDLKREIRNRMEESHAKRRSEILARMEALQTPSERRAALQAELEKLDGKAPAAVPVTVG